jgi:hypothetical protein
MARRSTIRASDADREQVAERLRHATGEGRLLAEELEDRLGAVFSARTYGDLDAVVADLPRRELSDRRSRGRTLQTVRSLPPLALVILFPMAVALIVAAAAVTAMLFAIWLVVFVVTLGAFGHRRRRYFYHSVRYTRSMPPPRSWWA